MIKSVLLPVTTSLSHLMFEEEKQQVTETVRKAIADTLAELDQHFNEGFEVKSSHFCQDKHGGFVMYLLHREDDQLEADEEIPLVPTQLIGLDSLNWDELDHLKVQISTAWKKVHEAQARFDDHNNHAQAV